jgi:cytoskeletal protein RodZ
MARSSAPDPNLLIEIGQLLHEARIKQGLSMEDMYKKLCMRVDQIQAIEEGNAIFFQTSTQPLIWFARLYAKKLGVSLPDMVSSDIQRTQKISSQAQTKIPAFLMKNSQPTEK